VSGWVACAGSSPAAGEAVRLLRRSGQRAVTGKLVEPPEAEILIALPAPREVEELERWNAVALATGRAWLQVLPWDGRMLAAGPLYLPGVSACFTCYALRRAAALGLGDAGRTVLNEPTRARAGVALPALAAAIAVDQALGWLADHDPQRAGVLHAVDDRGGLNVTPHAVLPVPLCPTCRRAA
jgi:bacteriocin biosynthesis cyclodehydratase domain-containing protein